MNMHEINERKCDIVVVGSGVSGLCASVQAAKLGKKVILLESCRRVGGNWDATYGMMATESPLSKAQNIHVDARALLNQEIRLFDYQVDSKLWMDLVNNSGKNVEWLMEQGVEFNPVLEPYTAGDINAPVFHRWAEGKSASDQMISTFEHAGGTILNQTKATKLIIEDGAVAGIIAESKSEGEITIRCKAVISAGGGYAKNPDMVERTTGRRDCACRGIAKTDGSSINMCIEAGAKSLVDHGNFITDIIPAGMHNVNHWLSYIHSRPGSYPFQVDVNQDAERYVDESCTLKLYAFLPSASFTQEKTYTIYDEEKLRKLEEYNHNGVYKNITGAAEAHKEGVVKADSFEELAEKLGLDPKKLASTMNQYNEYCRQGADPDYEKTAEWLQEFKAPFYGWENTFQIASSIEGIDYNRKMEVLDARRKPITGLYVAGVDGAKIWRDYYSLAIPGSCNSNNVNSGRIAAKNAAAYINTLA